MQFPSIPELEVLAVQIAAFILLLFALGAVLVVGFFHLKRIWIKERHETDAIVIPKSSP